MDNVVTVKELKDYINPIDAKYDDLLVTVPSSIVNDYGVDCHISNNISGWLDTYRNTYHIDMWLR